MKDLVADLKASLNDAASTFTSANDADFERFLNTAAGDFIRARPRTLVDSVTLVADQAEYAAPADFHDVKAPLWGRAPKPMPQPWQSNYPGALPRLKTIELAGTRQLHLDPPPSANQIAVLGAEYRFYYYAQHVIHATNTAQTTLPAGDRGLLILRAQAEAMRELAMRNMKKPVTMRDGLNMSTTRNSTPAALYRALMDEFNKNIREAIH